MQSSFIDKILDFMDDYPISAEHGWFEKSRFVHEIWFYAGTDGHALIPGCVYLNDYSAAALQDSLHILDDGGIEKIDARDQVIFFRVFVDKHFARVRVHKGHLMVEISVSYALIGNIDGNIGNVNADDVEIVRQEHCIFSRAASNVKGEACAR